MRVCIRSLEYLSLDSRNPWESQVLEDIGRDRQIPGWSLKEPSLAMLFYNAETGSENAHHSLRRLEAWARMCEDLRMLWQYVILPGLQL